jgi:hypothetical protein
MVRWTISSDERREPKRAAGSWRQCLDVQALMPVAAARFAGVRPAKGPLDLLLTGLTAGGGDLLNAS